MWRCIYITAILIVMSYTRAKASYCDNLDENNSYVPKERYVSINGELKNVTLYWNSNETRAASALLAILLRHLVGYQRVHLHQKPHEDLQKNEVMLSITDPSQPYILPRIEDKNRIKCPDQMRIGQHQFYVYLPDKFQKLKQCANATTWHFYSNITAVRSCGFFDKDLSDNRKGATRKQIELYTLNKDVKKIKEVLANNANVNIAVTTCLNILRMLNTSSHSFLFYEDDIWPETTNVKKLQLPPCKPIADTNNTNLNTDIYVRLANVAQIIEYAPAVYRIVHNLVFNLDYLKVILEIETITESIEEAACDWAWQNFKKVRTWADPLRYSNENVYYIVHLYDGFDVKLHSRLPRILAHYVQPYNYIENNSFDIGYYKQSIKSRDIDYIKDILEYFTTGSGTCLSHTRQKILGAVIGNMKNMSDVARYIDGVNLPVFLYSEPNVKIKAQKSVWLSTGTSLHLALALQRFIMAMNWTRVAVLSNPTELAQDFYNKLLRVKKKYSLRDHHVPHNISSQQADILLGDLLYENARIIFINTNYEDARTILSEADRFKMNRDYVWIVRDWQPTNITLNLRHIGLSQFCRNISDCNVSNDRINEVRSLIRKELWPDGAWPIQAPALADAILTLVNGFEAVFRKYPQSRHDVHSELTMREFGNSLNDKFVGLTRNLVYKGQYLDEAMVYIELWQGMQREVLAKCRVFKKVGIATIETKSHSYSDYAKVNDGAINEPCFIKLGDPYLPICYDIPLFAVVGIISGLIIIWLTVKIISPSAYHKVSRG